jgi:coenzyme F420-reducing hydrogenase gamma subunit
MPGNKPKVALFDFTGCEGCQLTVIDSLQNHIELLDAVEIVQFREAMSEKGENYQIAIIEGSCTNNHDVKRLKGIREQAQIVVALGACAHDGCVNVLRNWGGKVDERLYVYGEMGYLYEDYRPRPIKDVIKVDAYIPGCPINPEEFIMVTKALLLNRKPFIPDYPVCVECKLSENVCMYLLGKTCIGPIARAGCGAICPRFQFGCEGCRGLISNPNMNWLLRTMRESGLSASEIQARLDLFMTYDLMKAGNNRDGTHSDK